MPPELRPPMRIVAGPFLPEPEWQALRASVDGTAHIELVRSVPDLGAEMRRAAVSVSQCGYNTAMDILQAHVSNPPPPLPAELQGFQPLLDRLLAKKPNDRFDTASQVYEALGACVG